MGSPDPIDAEPERLLDAGLRLDGADSVPALLIRRAKDVHEPLIGKRARFLMTSHSPEGDWLAYGWKDSLRIVSEPGRDAGQLEEDGIWVQEERDFYGDCDTTNRFAVGLSRVWVEQYVSAAPEPAGFPEHAWIDNLNRDPNSSEFRRLVPVEGCPDPVGRRVLVIGEEVLIDLRAVGPVRMASSGALAIPIMAERDWYRWARDYPAAPHPTLRWENAAVVWLD